MNDEELLKSLYTQYYDLAYKLVSEGKMDYKDHYKFSRNADEVIKSAYTSRTDYVSKNFVDKEFAKACYQDVLETDVHFEDILVDMAKQNDKTEEWLAEVRINKCHYSKDIVSEFKEHPVQMAMTKTKRFIPSHAINKTSFRGLLNYTQESVNQWKSFNESVSNTEVIKSIKAELEGTRWDVQRLNDTLKLAPSDKKDKAKYLISKGYSHQQVAEVIGVTKKTITRWCKEG